MARGGIAGTISAGTRGPLSTVSGLVCLALLGGGLKSEEESIVSTTGRLADFQEGVPGGEGLLLEGYDGLQLSISSSEP